MFFKLRSFGSFLRMLMISSLSINKFAALLVSMKLARFYNLKLTSMSRMPLCTFYDILRLGVADELVPDIYINNSISINTNSYKNLFIK